MSTRVAVEEIEVTTGEKVLAVVLAIFISVGAVWSYVRIDNIGAENGTVTVQASQSERAAIEAHRAATASYSTPSAGRGPPDGRSSSPRRPIGPHLTPVSLQRASSGTTSPRRRGSRTPRCEWPLRGRTPAKRRRPRTKRSKT